MYSDTLNVSDLCNFPLERQQSRVETGKVRNRYSANSLGVEVRDESKLIRSMPNFEPDVKKPSRTVKRDDRQRQAVHGGET